MFIDCRHSVLTNRDKKYTLSKCLHEEYTTRPPLDKHKQRLANDYKLLINILYQQNYNSNPFRARVQTVSKTVQRFTLNSEQLFPEVDVSSDGYLPSREFSSGKVNIHHYSLTLRGIIVLVFTKSVE